MWTSMEYPYHFIKASHFRFFLLFVNIHVKLFSRVINLLSSIQRIYDVGGQLWHFLEVSEWRKLFIIRLLTTLLKLRLVANIMTFVSDTSYWNFFIFVLSIFFVYYNIMKPLNTINLVKSYRTALFLHELQVLLNGWLHMLHMLIKLRIIRPHFQYVIAQNMWAVLLT